VIWEGFCPVPLRARNPGMDSGAAPCARWGIAWRIDARWDFSPAGPHRIRPISQPRKYPECIPTSPMVCVGVMFDHGVQLAICARTCQPLAKEYSTGEPLFAGHWSTRQVHDWMRALPCGGLSGVMWGSFRGGLEVAQAIGMA
jgi:hypothetical protein